MTWSPARLGFRRVRQAPSWQGLSRATFPSAWTRDGSRPYNRVSTAVTGSFGAVPIAEIQR